jgi:ParB/RepB/Spo0J family partition protein
MKLKPPPKKSPAVKKFLKPGSTPAKVGSGLKLGGGKLVTEKADLATSTLKVFDIPIVSLVEHKENPNEQNEKTFDSLVERIREDGIDEPILVYPELIKMQPTGKYVIYSGHHRVKAAKVVGLTKVPAIIREGWDEDRYALELVTRNNLTGKMNPHKFTELFDRLKKKYDPEQLKKMMGFTEKKAFDVLFKQVRDQLPEKAKKKLDEAKESVKSVEDLSSVLNTIFREHGSEVDHSFMVFTYGGKKHHYIQVDSAMHKMVEELSKTAEDKGLKVGDIFKALLMDGPHLANVIGKLAK